MIKGSILYSTAQKTAVCVKCDKTMDVEIQRDEETRDTMEDEPEQITTVPKSTYDEGSKKIGDLLLQGWCMKESSCMVCLMPHMQGRNKELICVNCGPVDAKTKQPIQPVKKHLKKEEYPKKSEKLP